MVGHFQLDDKQCSAATGSYLEQVTTGSYFSDDGLLVTEISLFLNKGC